ncbi:MAG: hypothetical protein WBM23_03745 [Desulfomonilia bacterium]
MDEEFGGRHDHGIPGAASSLMRQENIGGEVPFPGLSGQGNGDDDSLELSGFTAIIKKRSCS